MRSARNLGFLCPGWIEEGILQCHKGQAALESFTGLVNGELIEVCLAGCADFSVCVAWLLLLRQLLLQTLCQPPFSGLDLKTELVYL